MDLFYQETRAQLALNPQLKKAMETSSAAAAEAAATPVATSAPSASSTSDSSASAAAAAAAKSVEMWFLQHLEMLRLQQQHQSKPVSLKRPANGVDEASVSAAKKKPVVKVT